jgi:hypothetical protein
MTDGHNRQQWTDDLKGDVSPYAQSPSPLKEKVTPSSEYPFDRETSAQYRSGLETCLNIDDVHVEDLESDFAVSAFRHLHAAVINLTNEHTRRMAFLQQQNEELDRKLQVALKDTKKYVPGSSDMDQLATFACASKPSVQPSMPNGDGQLEEKYGDEYYEPYEPPLSSIPEEPCAERDLRIGNMSGSQDTDVIPDNKPPSYTQKLERVVHSAKFDSIIGSVIIANTIVMSLQLEYSGRVFKDEVLDACTDCDVRTRSIETCFKVMEHIFTAIFFIELSLRLFFDGCKYWRSTSNALDGLIVIVSVKVSWFVAPMGSDLLGSVAVLRMIRLL